MAFSIPLFDAGGRSTMNIAPTLSRQPHHEPWTCQHLEYKCAVVLGCSIEPGTASCYSSALQSYLTFCHIHKFPTEPTPDLFSFYAIYMSHHINPKSVNSYLSGICNQLEPFFPDVCKAYHHHLFTKTLQGCRQM